MVALNQGALDIVSKVGCHLGHLRASLLEFFSFGTYRVVEWYPVQVVRVFMLHRSGQQRSRHRSGWHCVIYTLTAGFASYKLTSSHNDVLYTPLN